jgi:ArsR family transcriptional regulator, arsenate/arsenite/antimonite-responsive transcriptional repressor
VKTINEGDAAMSRLSLLQLPARKLGERCCDPDARPTMTMAEAERATADLEILANPIRMQLLDMLARKEGTVCVCDLEAAVPVKQPTVSHHLKVLREAGLVHSEKQGLYAYYRVNRDALNGLRDRIAERLATLG